MKESEKCLPLEKKFFELEVDGNVKNVPGIDRTWLEVKKRHFSRYTSHPVQVNGSFLLGEKEAWLELVEFVRSDLEWLLQQKHHVFWSYMIFSSDAKQLLISFLQEAPPYYMRNEFPKDEEMEKALEKVEKLVFLVFVRLTTARESHACYVENLGELLYENYLFTVPILLDICLIYGVSNSDLVAKMLNDVVDAAPQYLSDFEEIVPHFLYVLSVLRKAFDCNEILKLKEDSVSNSKHIRDVILFLYDSAANIHIFLEMFPKGSRLFRVESFCGEVSSFYTNVIPKIYSLIKKKVNCDFLRTWNFREKIDSIRFCLLSIVRNVFCGIVNDALNNYEQRDEYANDYLTKIMEILQETLFLSDYNRLHPIDADMKMLREVCQEMDSENLRYILEAIAPLNEPERETSHSRRKSLHLNDFLLANSEVESMITEVKDILPHLGDGFVEACLRYYDYSTERVIAGILENKLPAELTKLDRNLVRSESSKPARSRSDATAREAPKKTEEGYEDAVQLLNDKTELNQIRERFSNLVLVSDDEYNDEYDDTYDSQDVSIRGVDDTVDQERRPFVTPRVLRTREEIEEDDEDDEKEDEKQSKVSNNKNNDWFVPNPAEVRERQEQRRQERMKRDYVGRGRGRGQDKQVHNNRSFKDSHKSFMANHNRRKLASRKRNMPLLHS